MIMSTGIFLQSKIQDNREYADLIILLFLNINIIYVHRRL